MTNELEPLKECPFCHVDGTDKWLGEEVNHSFDERYAPFLYSARIMCLRCGASIESDGLFCKPEEAKASVREKWNTRHKKTCKVDWRDGDWGVCECGGDVYEHDVYCSTCGCEVTNKPGDGSD